MSDKPEQQPDWVERISQSLDHSLEQLDQPLRNQLAWRRSQVLNSARRHRLLKRSAWVGVAVAACFAVVVVGPVFKHSSPVQDDLALMQDLDLLENLELLEAMGDDLHGV